MNLEALALRRAEEQMDDAWKRPDPGERRPFVIVNGGKGCDCGRCHRCRNREWMRAWRAGGLVRHACVKCGKRIRRNAAAGWCERCRNKTPAQFRAYARANFNDGGGI